MKKNGVDDDEDVYYRAADIPKWLPMSGVTHTHTHTWSSHMLCLCDAATAEVDSGRNEWSSQTTSFFNRLVMPPGKEREGREIETEVATNWPATRRANSEVNEVNKREGKRIATYLNEFHG